MRNNWDWTKDQPVGMTYEARESLTKLMHISLDNRSQRGMIPTATSVGTDGHDDPSITRPVQPDQNPES